MTGPAQYTVLPVGGLPEIRAGDDLAILIADAALAGPGLLDGDILVITSKIVSKAEARVVAADRESAIDAETVRVVARRGPTTISQTRQGLVLAAAGVDASNTAPGTVVLLPVDPDNSALRLRKAMADRSGARIGVRSRKSVTASASFNRLASSSTSLVWSFQTVTSCPRILVKHGNVRIVFCQSSRIAMFIRVSSV